jgi:hypothetical protein
MASARFAMAIASSTVNDRRRIDPIGAVRNSERHRIGTIQSESLAQAASAAAENFHFGCQRNDNTQDR